MWVGGKLLRCNLISNSCFQTYFDEYKFPCGHGFFNRGNLTMPRVEECVNTAMDHLLTFMGEYVISDNSTVH